MSCLLLTSCLDSLFGPEIVFDSSGQMYRIFMVAHYQHSFTGCSPVSETQKEKILEMMDVARRNPPEVFKETETYMTFGPGETAAEHFFASKKDCDFFAQNLLDMHFKLK